MAPLPTETFETHKHISNCSLFQELSTITKVMEEMHEVNFNEDIKDMNISDFNQDTS